VTTHSVRRHLRLETAAYDETIRRFIPGYEPMIAVAAREVAGGVVPPAEDGGAPGAGLVLDLGGGTGALAEAILAHPEVDAVALIDVDDEMLVQARARLERFADRVRFRAQSFFDPLPPCGGVAASLALHHVRSMDDKRALYRRIHDALRPSGRFVNADATMPAEPDGRAATWRVWADHMVRCGIDEAQAFAHFEEWAEEDTYFPLEEELAAMRAAGFRADCVWREGGMTVVTGRKPAPAGASCSRRGRARARVVLDDPDVG
jgi:tRNA (cmo5U34)-methyltransferase